MTDKEQKDIHFHSTEKGCTFIDKKIEAVANLLGGGKKLMDSGHCEVHKVDCCRCGWEWGHHYGNDNKKLNYQERYHLYDL